MKENGIDLIQYIRAAVHQKATAHADPNYGIQILAVRKDIAVALAGADGYYIPLIVDATGHLHTREKDFGGAFYTDNFTAPDAASEAALGAVKLRHCIIRNTHVTYEAEIRDGAGDWIEIPAASSREYYNIDLAAVFCKAQLDAENPVLDISGTEI